MVTKVFTNQYPFYFKGFLPLFYARLSRSTTKAQYKAKYSSDPLSS